MGDGDRDGLRFLTGGGLTYSCAGSTDTLPSVEGRGDSIGVPSGFFLLVYFRFSDGFGDSGTTDSLATVFPALGTLGGGGVIPPLASRLAAFFCSRASSARSRLDIIPSLGGRPGPRRRVGCESLSPFSIESIAWDDLESLVFRTIFFEGSLLSPLSLPSLSDSSSSSSTSIEARASCSSSSSSFSANFSSIRSAPVSPIGTSGSKNRMRTPPIWM